MTCDLFNTDHASFQTPIKLYNFVENNNTDEEGQEQEDADKVPYVDKQALMSFETLI